MKAAKGGLSEFCFTNATWTTGSPASNFNQIAPQWIILAERTRLRFLA
jgi:hypothetical protein